MDKSISKEIMTWVKVFGIIVVAIPCGIVVLLIVFVIVMSTESTNKISSPDGKFDVIVSKNIEAAHISVESKNGESRKVAELCTPSDLQIVWNTNKEFSINFSGNECSSFFERHVDLERERIFIDVNLKAAVSMDHEYIARLSGPIYRKGVYVSSRKDEPAKQTSEGDTDGIYIERTDAQQKWLVAKQTSTRKLNAQDIDFVWRTGDRFYIFSDDTVVLKMKELDDGGQKIKIILLPLRNLIAPDGVPLILEN